MRRAFGFALGLLWLPALGHAGFDAAQEVAKLTRRDQAPVYQGFYFSFGPWAIPKTHPNDWQGRPYFGSDLILLCDYAADDLLELDIPSAKLDPWVYQDAGDEVAVVHQGVRFGRISRFKTKTIQSLCAGVVYETRPADLGDGSQVYISSAKGQAKGMLQRAIQGVVAGNLNRPGAEGFVRALLQYKESAGPGGGMEVGGLPGRKELLSRALKDGSRFPDGTFLLESVVGTPAQGQNQDWAVYLCRHGNCASYRWVSLAGAFRLNGGWGVRLSGCKPDTDACSDFLLHVTDKGFVEVPMPFEPSY